MASNKKNIIEAIKVVAILVLIATIAGVILGVVKPITDIDAEELFKKNMSKILESTYKEQGKNITPKDETQEINNKNKELFKETKTNQVLKCIKLTGKVNGKDLENAYVFEVKGRQAFKDKIEMYVLIENNKIKNITVKSSEETPGLGTKVLDSEYFKNYIDKDIKSIESFNLVKKPTNGANDIVARTGATKTSTALINSVNAAVKAYRTIVKEGK